MSNKPAPILIMSLMVILVLAVSGVAYGLWTQSLQILGNVSTAGLNVIWDPTSCQCTDANVSCTIDPNDPTLVTFSVSDVYPGYASTCYFTLNNAGSMAVDITNEEVVPANFTNGTELDVVFKNGLGKTLNPGDTEAAQLDVAVLDDAAQNTTYEFTVDVEATQH